MKLKSILSLLFVLLLSGSIYSANPETIMFSNIEQTTEGCVKEFLFCDKDTQAPVSKTIYYYDAAGRMMEKTVYDWDSTNGWVGNRRFLFNYDENNEPVTPTVTKWDRKRNDWSLKPIA